MESLVNDSSLSPTKQVKNSRRKTHHLDHHHQQLQHQRQLARQPNISRQSSCGAMHQKFAPSPHVQMEMVHDAIAGGVFLNHFPKQYSLPFSQPPILLPTYYQNHQPKIITQHPQHQQPPLLPLPVVSQPTFRSLPPPLTRGHSLSAPLTRGHSLSSAVPRKQPNKTKLNPTAAAATTKKTTTPQNKKKELVKESEATTKQKKNDGSSLVEYDQDVGSAKEVKPEPKEVPRVLPAWNRESEVVEERKEKYFTAASVFSLAPPPSSLPLPKFPLRKLQQNKLSCNAEAAAEVDTGATDNLCRLLKLR